MTPDERMDEALTELEILIGSGSEPVDAIFDCASQFGFKPDVVQLRAEKKFGDLATLGMRIKGRRANETQEHLAATAIDAFLIEKPEPTFPHWFEMRVGRAPTEVENDDFTARYMKHVLRDFKFEI